MTNRTPLEKFAYGLGDKVVLEAEKILKDHGLSETKFYTDVSTYLGEFQITVTCNEFKYVVPKISIFTHFLAGTWEKEINDYVTSYGKYLAWDYLRFCGIEYEKEDY